MGTNYYLHRESDTCPHCGRTDNPLHIGKSSIGWCFALHVMPEDGINDLDDWRRLWEQDGAVIKNECGDIEEPEDMLHIIRARHWQNHGVPFGYPSWEEFYRMNHAAPGPNGLVRHAIGGDCIGHGDGTWDLITGEFS